MERQWRWKSCRTIQPRGWVQVFEKNAKTSWIIDGECLLLCLQSRRITSFCCLFVSWKDERKSIKCIHNVLRIMRQRASMYVLISSITLFTVVSFFSAALGGLIALRYRRYEIVFSHAITLCVCHVALFLSHWLRSSSIRAFGIRNCPNKKQDVSTDQLCEDAPNRPSRQTGEMKKNAIDLKFFMEDNQDNEIYATLDDQVSLNSDTDNITTYHRKNGFYNKSDVSIC